MPKGTSWAEVTLNSETIKLVALAVIKLYACLKASVRQPVENSDNFLNFIATFWKEFWVNLKAYLGLVTAHHRLGKLRLVLG